MPSNIDDKVPVTGNPTTASMRDNFATAKTEISQLQTNVTTAQTTANAKASIASDLGGTAAAPTVIRLQGRSMANTAPTSGQPLVWNGTAWAPGSSGAVGNYLPLTGGTMTGPISFGPSSYPARLRGDSQELVCEGYMTGASTRFIVGSKPPDTYTFYGNGGNGPGVFSQYGMAVQTTNYDGYASDSDSFRLLSAPVNNWMAGMCFTVYHRPPYQMYESGADLLLFGGMGVNGSGTQQYGTVLRISALMYDPELGSPAGELELMGKTAIKVGGGSWSAPSDGRLKTNVESYSAGLAEIDQLNPITFRYNGRGGTHEGGPFIGLAAEEAKAVMPELVNSYRGKIDYDDPEETDILLLDPSALTYATLNALKELNRRLKALEDKAKQ